MNAPFLDSPQVRPYGKAPESFVGTNMPDYAPTTEDAQFRGPMPQTKAEMLIRGTAGEGVRSSVATVMRKKFQMDLQKEFESLMSRKEAGANDMIRSAVENYGNGVIAYLPPKELFYDMDTGAFMPYKYAQAVYVGVQKYKGIKGRSDAVKGITGLAGDQSIRTREDFAQKAAPFLYGDDSGVTPENAYNMTSKQFPSQNDLSNQENRNSLIRKREHDMRMGEIRNKISQLRVNLTERGLDEKVNVQDMAMITLEEKNIKDDIKRINDTMKEYVKNTYPPDQEVVTGYYSQINELKNELSNLNNAKKELKLKQNQDRKQKQTGQNLGVKAEFTGRSPIPRNEEYAPRYVLEGGEGGGAPTTVPESVRENIRQKLAGRVPPEKMEEVIDEIIAKQIAARNQQ
jgi:hypothetical protein